MDTPINRNLVLRCPRCDKAVVISTDPDTKEDTAQLWTCPACRAAHLIRTPGRILSVTA